MKDVIAELDAWSEVRVAPATVVEVKRSAPRPPGACGGTLRDAEGRIQELG